MTLTTKVFLADEVYPGSRPNGMSLVEQVNAFLESVPGQKVKDIQYHLAKDCQVGASAVFGAWVVYEKE